MTGHDLDAETRQAVYDVAVLLYQKHQNGGADAVYAFAGLLDWEAWRSCVDCDAVTPDLLGDCMVCGQVYTTSATS